MTQTFTPGSAAQPASRKRPAASIEASSTAAPPASKRSKPSADTSGGPSRSAAQPAHTTAQERCTLCYAGSKLDPDTGEEVYSDMSRASIFESAGLCATCSLCGNAIICGVLHSGSCNQNPECGDEDEDIDPRAERPLMFENHELVRGTPLAADHAMVTFLHRCHAPGVQQH